MVACVIVSGAAFRDGGEEPDDGPTQDDESIGRPGLVAEYRQGERIVGRIDRRLAFLLRPGESPHPLVRPEEWQVQWSGTIDVRIPGRYRFAAAVLGRFELTVGRQVVLEVDSGNSTVPVRRQGTEIELPHGRSKISATFSNRKGQEAALRLFRQLPDGFEESVLPSAFAHAPTDETRAIAQSQQFDAGRRLIAQNRCLACHHWTADPARDLALAPPPARSFEQIRSRFPRAWLAEWLSNPRERQPAARMPRLFADGAAERVDLAAVVEFFSSLPVASDSESGKERRSDTSQHSGPSTAAESVVREPPAQDRPPEGDARATVNAGRALFAKSGCIACHCEPGEPRANADGLWRLDHVSIKYSRDQLSDLIGSATPVSSTQSGMVAASRAGHEPALDLAHLDPPGLSTLVDFLVTPVATLDGPPGGGLHDLNPSEAAVRERIGAIVNDPAERASFDPLPPVERLRRLGAIVAKRRGCIHCHRTSDNQPLDDSAPEFGEIIRKAARHPAGDIVHRGCLASRPELGIPDFDLSDADRAAIDVVLRTLAQTESTGSAPQERLENILSQEGCAACHERGTGLSRFSRRITEFVPLVGDATLRDISPPSLEGAGERLRPGWMREALANDRRARSWLDVKMPHYNPDRIEPLVDLLVRFDGLDPAEEQPQTPAANGAALEGARELIGRTGLNCVGCHDFGSYRGTGIRSPDLTSVPHRLHEAWFRQWLHDPQSIARGTRMPSFFSSGHSALPRILGGREETQVAAIWSYLSRDDQPLPAFPNTGAPSGSAGEFTVLIPADRPLLVHGFMPGNAGLRGIAIGSPPGVHFAFDSEKCLLTRVWTGPFVRHEGWEDSGKNSPDGNGLAILGDVVWRDDSPERAARLLGTNDIDGTNAREAPVRFDESWATRLDAGISWSLKSPKGERIRIEDRPEAAPRLGIVAFRRRLRVTGLPAETGLSLRVFSGCDPNHASSPPTAVADWVRIPQGRFDWLVRGKAPDEGEAWRWSETIPSAETRARPGVSLWIDLPARPREGSLPIELEYVRVARGGDPPAEQIPKSAAEGTE